MQFENSIQFAQQMDQADPLSEFRKKFLFPQHNGQNVVYLCGNSLGLQPVESKKALLTELDDWEKFGVEGHFEAKNPWFSYHEMFKEPLAKMVGAKPEEVTALNGLTANLHFLMVSFYRPTEKRYKILCEAKAFPSDQYALESQVRFHGYDPKDAIVEIAPREGKHIIEEEDILKAIDEHGDEIALFMFGGVNYYTGQCFDMKMLASQAKKKGIVVGYDLAHAAGNIELKLHDWEVDFAAWCSYKYLNSGPGSVAGIFVHEKHGMNPDLPRFAGWWGTDPKDRFLMEPGFKPDFGADGWQLSNAPVLAMAVHKVSLDIFMEAGMDRLIEKRNRLTNYLEFVINDVSTNSDGVDIEIITPKSESRRGAQISILTTGMGKDLFDYLSQNGVIADWREPNVIRMAPVPLYNSFEDVFSFGRILSEGIKKLS